MAKKNSFVTNWMRDNNKRHYNAIKDHQSAETLLSLTQMRELPEVQARPVIDRR